MMSVIIQVITAVLLLCSISGYMMFTKARLKLQTEFIPVFVCSSIGCAMYFCGLAGYLLPGAVAVFAAGIVLFVLYLAALIRRRAYLNFRISLFLAAFGTGSLFFFHQLLVSRLIHYDNFSHWAIVVKYMLSTNAFPDAASALIDFKNYPLGSSSFIYFICRFAGNSQAVMLAAQGFLIFACFYAMFGVITEKKRFLLYAFLAAGCSVLSIFNITIRISNLLVDFLLPIYTLVLFVMIYKYQREIKKACISIIPVAGFLMIIKNTGTIFAGIGLIYLVYVWLRNRDKPLWKNGLGILLSIGAAFIPCLLWGLHVAAEFKGVENKFEISADSIRNIYGGKSPEEIGQIISLFVKTVFDITSRPAMGVAGFHIAAITAGILAAVLLKKNWNLWKALAALDTVLIGYYVGILGLYIFSMPLDEATRLAGFERYASSIVVLFAGGLILCATVDIENSFYYKTGEVPSYRAFKTAESKGRYQKGIILFTALAVTLLMSEYNGMKTIQRSYKTTLPYKVFKVTGDRWYSGGRVDEARYLFYASDADGQVTDYYLQYIGKYMLYAPNVDGICAFYEDNLIHLLISYDYLVIVESDAEAKYLMKKYFGVSGQEGIYKIIHSGGELAVEPDAPVG
ncbi:hypothetical protein [Clostridium sp. Marseille-P2415]|uniref:hypothetical protein n=1 Tax=Clostridium sp. Marseille-P2415 TaxID=1805471 RepID=UPI0009884DCF|nr:hypothetical protein [Clostridium sp. Marseille-P2415]